MISFKKYYKPLNPKCKLLDTKLHESSLIEIEKLVSTGSTSNPLTYPHLECKMISPMKSVNSLEIIQFVSVS